MELSGAALRRTPVISGNRAFRDSLAAVPASPSMLAIGRRARGNSPAFSDPGHIMYYASPVRCGCGRNKKEEKKRAKLVKGLSKDLAALCTVGIGADASEGLHGEVKGKMIKEAAELLMAELKQLRAQEKETKRKMKEEKAAMKAAKMKGCAKVDESSSSSSSESSDSDCHSEVVRMSSLRIPAIQGEPKSEILTIAPETTKPEEIVEHITASIACCSSSNCNNITSVVEKPVNTIEVCMGGKCKRSGAMELMEEFNKKIGFEGAVVGCKCMGKCRDGPNVRVLNHADGVGATASAPRNPLCLGVGVGDVGTIVASFFGENDARESLLAA